MAQSQCVAQYSSDSESDNDMELESSNNTRWPKSYRPVFDCE